MKLAVEFPSLSYREGPAMGFGWITLNVTAIFQAGARSVDAISDELRYQ